MSNFGEVMRHCDNNMPFEKKWFLKNIDNFKSRTLEIGKCEICKKEIICLTEIRITDNKKFETIQSGKKAKNIIKRERKRIDYIITKTKTYARGWVYGVNKERKNKYGRITSIKQYAFDYQTNSSKGLVKTNKIDYY